MIGPYGGPQAFRTALEARLKNIAHGHGTDLQRLQRRVAFERLLARLFAQDDPPWLLKGGYALELRLADRARSTLLTWMPAGKSGDWARPMNQTSRRARE